MAKNYTAAQKRKAVIKAKEIGIGRASKELKISPITIKGWLAKADKVSIRNIMEKAVLEHAEAPIEGDRLQVALIRLDREIKETEAQLHSLAYLKRFLSGDV